MRLGVIAAQWLLASAAWAAPQAAPSWPDLGTQVVATHEGAQDAAFIVAVEDYLKVDDVAGARVSADAWMRWFLAGRGIPAARIFKAYDGDATDIQIRELARRAASSVRPGGTLWFVFIGHGAPSLDGRDGMLVGADADRSAQGIYQRSVPRSELLTLLDAGAQGQAVVLLDACFSGQSVSGRSLVEGLQPLVPTALVARPSARTRVLSAAGSGEFSGPLPGANRPAFSYLALGALMGWADVDGTGNRDGEVSAAEVRDYVQGVLNVTLQGRTQTPQLLGDDAILGIAAAREAPALAAMAARERTTDRGGASLDAQKSRRVRPVLPAGGVHAHDPHSKEAEQVYNDRLTAPPRQRPRALIAGAGASFLGAGVLLAMWDLGVGYPDHNQDLAVGAIGAAGLGAVLTGFAVKQVDDD